MELVCLENHQDIAHVQIIQKSYFMLKLVYILSNVLV
jgi:hypothetical protein